MNPSYGDPRLPARFWNNVLEDLDTGCWTWQGKPDRDGYPNRTSTTDARHRRRPYQWSYEALIGPIPSETLNHKCLNKMCVRPIPSHAGDPMSHVENVRDAKARTVRCPKGHPYDYENTFYRKDGRRECRQCMRDRVAAQRAAKDPEVLRASWRAENARRADRRRTAG